MRRYQSDMVGHYRALYILYLHLLHLWATRWNVLSQQDMRDVSYMGLVHWVDWLAPHHPPPPPHSGQCTCGYYKVAVSLLQPLHNSIGKTHAVLRSSIHEQQVVCVCARHGRQIIKYNTQGMHAHMHTRTRTHTHTHTHMHTRAHTHTHAHTQHTHSTHAIFDFLEWLEDT